MNAGLESWLTTLAKTLLSVGFGWLVVKLAAHGVNAPAMDDATLGILAASFVNWVINALTRQSWWKYLATAQAIGPSSYQVVKSYVDQGSAPATTPANAVPTLTTPTIEL